MSSVVICTVTRRITLRRDLYIVFYQWEGDEHTLVKWVTRAEAAQHIRRARREDRRNNVRVKYYV